MTPTQEEDVTTDATSNVYIVENLHIHNENHQFAAAAYRIAAAVFVMAIKLRAYQHSALRESRIWKLCIRLILEVVPSILTNMLLCEPDATKAFSSFVVSFVVPYHNNH